MHLLMFENLQNCIDVEAAVRGGKLDVGIFGPETVLSDHNIETILSRIRKDLEDLLLLI